MFDEDNDGFMSDAGWIALIGAGYARRSRQRQEQGLEYQRQQLNLLREHQGLPPIPAPRQQQYQGRSVLGEFLGLVGLFLVVYFVVMVVLAFIWPMASMQMLEWLLLIPLRALVFVVELIPVIGG